MKRRIDFDPNPALLKRANVREGQAFVPVPPSKRYIDKERELETQYRNADLDVVNAVGYRTYYSYRAKPNTYVVKSMIRTRLKVLRTKWSHKVLSWMESKSFPPIYYSEVEHYWRGQTTDVLHVAPPQKRCYVTNEALRLYAMRQKRMAGRSTRFARCFVKRFSSTVDAYIASVTSTDGEHWESPNQVIGITIPSAWYDWVGGNRKATKTALYHPISPLAGFPADLKRMLIRMIRDSPRQI